MSKFEKVGAVISAGVLSTTLGCSPERSTVSQNEEPDTLEVVAGYTGTDPQCNTLELSQTGPGTVAIRTLFSEFAGSQYSVDSVLLNVYDVAPGEDERDPEAIPADVVAIESDGYMQMELAEGAFVQIEGQLVVEDAEGDLGLAPQADECIIQVSAPTNPTA